MSFGNNLFLIFSTVSKPLKCKWIQKYLEYYTMGEKESFKRTNFYFSDYCYSLYKNWPI